MPSKDLEKFMWDMFALLERRGLIQHTGDVYAFCHADKTKHERGWYYHIKTGDSFYLCFPSDKAVIEFQSTKDKQSGRYAVVDWIDLINHLI